MSLSAETQHLIRKTYRQALQPIEIAICCVSALLAFSLTYCCACFRVRYADPGLAHAGIAACVAVTTLVALVAYLSWKRGRPCRQWIALAVCLSVAVASAGVLGEHYWWRYMVGYFNWREMASYVNVDPATDKGQSYMDAGVIYFKEGSQPLRDRGVAFRNGRTYCVAPILRHPIEYQAGTGQLPTETGFVLPRSGTVDFWAVGEDCCGNSGEAFNCADANSPHARSGLRLLDDRARSMYLLAVQEWSASTGLPVRHPIFFTWVRDPVQYTEGIYDNSFGDFWAHFAVVAVVSIVGSFAVHLGLQQLGVQ